MRLWVLRVNIVAAIAVPASYKLSAADRFLTFNFQLSTLPSYNARTRLTTLYLLLAPFLCTDTKDSAFRPFQLRSLIAIHPSRWIQPISAARRAFDEQ